MNDLERKFHEKWLGMAQPYQGLVASVVVLTDAGCMQRHGPEEQRRLIEFVGDTNPSIEHFLGFAEHMFGLKPSDFDGADAVPEALRLEVVEGQGQTVRPTYALKRQGPPPSVARRDGLPDDSTPASRAGDAYVMLVWELPRGLSFDEKESVTGAWHYEPQAKFDRLLRHCRVPIGLLTNGEELRLVYAPHGESTGYLTFRLRDLVTPSDGRVLLDAMVMLLHSRRFFLVEEERSLPALLEQSRRRQASVTSALAEQVFEALQVLLAGFQGASERDGGASLRDAIERGGDHLYGGLLTVLLRLVFVLYAEDRGLLPVDAAPYAEDLSVKALFEQLQRDQASFPDAMSRRFGAWPRLLALFRSVFFGARHQAFVIPPRKGELFDPETYPFLEGWSVGGAPVDPAAMAQVQVPSVDDETVFRVLERLLVLEGQRLSYQALDVEQIGSVYEALMGYRVERLVGDGVCTRGNRVWIDAGELAEVEPAQRAGWLEDHGGLDKKVAKAAAEAVKKAKTPEAFLEALEAVRHPKVALARPGTLVLQPGPERRRTSSHYTPRSLTESIVRRALEPLFKAMGETPTSERILNLKVCDPAMGSGAFLVEACRFLGDQLVAAWSREKKVDLAPKGDDLVMRARRLIAQRCLYGVDKNPFAVSLAKLSLWLVTLAKAEPFTFLDHALRCGDSLVGLGLEEIRAFHWKPEKQLDWVRTRINEALEQALEKRQAILDLATELEGPGAPATQLALDPAIRKQELLRAADDALEPVRALGDLVLEAFFRGEKDKAREANRVEALEAIRASDVLPARWPAELVERRRAFKATVRPFHWMLEFPEVFHGRRPDPLDGNQANRAAWMDCFVGNPPFAGKNSIAEMAGESYLPWLQNVHEDAHGNADYSAHFFRRAFHLLGEHGTFGLIATNTIGQGDTRTTGLQFIVRSKGEIYEAVRSMPWPGAANVAVSVVHVSKGNLVSSTAGHRLDGRRVEAVNSRLRAKPERDDPKPLKANEGKSYVGTYVLGMGFVLTPAQRSALIRKNKKNGERIFRYVGGEEVNSDPSEDLERYVINFGQMSLEEAGEWPDLLEIVRREVKPERDKNNRDTYRKYWWHFGEKRPALYEALRPLKRCLVTARVSKHLLVSWQDARLVFSEQCVVFPVTQVGWFSVLQSRVHEVWARLLSSSMRSDLRYSPSDCFETFPMPHWTTRLEESGVELEALRGSLQLDRAIGLTSTYNLLKDPGVTDADVLELRELHERLDREVLGAYGWSDIPVPAFCGASPSELEAFEDEVIDRLFKLNAERAAAEALEAPAPKSTKAPKKRATKATELQLDLVPPKPSRKKARA